MGGGWVGVGGCHLSKMGRRKSRRSCVAGDAGFSCDFPKKFALF